jgi:beta-1,4-N-acetylglucosaminyltransferase
MTPDTWHETRRTCLAFSPGGHRAELERALAGITFADVFHVTFDDGRQQPPGSVRRYHLCHPRRSVWRTAVNAWQSLLVLRRERPELVISTGADVAVPLLLLGKLYGAAVVFIETAGSAEPTLAGRLVYPMADLFIVQWPERLDRFPRAVLAEGLLL